MWWFSRIILVLAAVDSILWIILGYRWSLLSEADFEARTKPALVAYLGAWISCFFSIVFAWLAVYLHFKRYKIKDDKEGSNRSERKVKMQVVLWHDVFVLAILTTIAYEWHHFFSRL